MSRSVFRFEVTHSQLSRIKVMPVFGDCSFSDILGFSSATLFAVEDFRLRGFSFVRAATSVRPGRVPLQPQGARMIRGAWMAHGLPQFSAERCPPMQRN